MNRNFWTAMGMVAILLVMAATGFGAPPKVGNTVYVPSGSIDATTVTVTGSATLVVAAATHPRWYMFLQNNSSDTLHCSFATATPTVGGDKNFVLSPSGTNRDFPGGIPTNALYCISSGSSSKLLMEFGL